MQLYFAYFLTYSGKRKRKSLITVIQHTEKHDNNIPNLTSVISKSHSSQLSHPAYRNVALVYYYQGGCLLFGQQGEVLIKRHRRAIFFIFFLYKDINKLITVVYIYLLTLKVRINFFFGEK